MSRTCRHISEAVHVRGQLGQTLRLDLRLNRSEAAPEGDPES